MMSESELDAYITRMIDKEQKEMIELARGGAFHGRETEPSEIVGSLGERVGFDRVLDKDVRKN